MRRRAVQIGFCSVAILIAAGSAVHANTPPKLDDQQCKDMRAEKQKFLDSGLLANVEKGPAWAKANMQPDQLRQVQLYLMLDEQLKFACRDAVISLDAARAADTAKALEANPDSDPTAPKPAAVVKLPSINPAAMQPLAPRVQKPKTKPTAKPQAKKKPLDDAATALPGGGVAPAADQNPKPKPKPVAKPVTVTVEPDPTLKPKTAPAKPSSDAATPWVPLGDQQPVSGGLSP